MAEENNIQKNTGGDSYSGSGALDAFLNLLSLVTVGWFAISFGGVLFQIINKFFGERAFGYSSRFSLGALQFNTASIIILLPIVVAVTATLHKQYKARKLNPMSGIYRWLTYLMLFVAFCNIVGSLIALVYKVLEGDYQYGSLLKILVVFSIALAIFGYYFFDLKRTDYSERSPVSQGAGIAVIVVTLAVIVGGFVVAGSPQESRDRKFDSQRANDLSNLRFQLEEYYRRNTRLPENLTSAEFERFRDPKTDEPYEYSLVSEDSYEVCATFETDIDSSDDYEPYYYNQTDPWRYHDTGRQCYTLAVPKKTGEEKPTPVPAF